MKRNFSILLLFLFFVLTAGAQENASSFAVKSMNIQNTGMGILGGWALANMVTGAYGWAAETGSQKYFHQMNLFWNTVNLSIAGIALWNNASSDPMLLLPAAALEQQLKTEKILLINTALDIGYIGTGFLLQHLGAKNSERSDLLRGYGQSLVVQGAFLFVFDLSMYLLLHNHRPDAGFSLSYAPTPLGLGVRLTF
ncbi:MAG TPA: hypothetical protein PLK12_12175 [Prolixibacteraceae bacterium]|nr:hypothetical protein [Prolixibacteraceae bacterium]